MKDNEISQYSRMIVLRDLLKEIQQLSWNITQLDKKFPMEDAEEIGYENMIDAYMQFGDSILSIANDFSVLTMTRKNKEEDKK